MSSRSILKKQILEYVDTADEKTLEIVHRILKVSEPDPLESMSAEQEASFLRGLKDADENRVTSHYEVMEKYKQWTTK